MPLAYTTFKVIFAYAIELSSIYYLKLTVIHYISEQIKQRVRIGKILARWHLEMAITSYILKRFDSRENVLESDF